MTSSEETSPTLTSRQLAQTRVIARGARIRDIKRLVETYGGSVKRWVKKSSPPLIYSGKLAEIHWYEHHSIGRFEEKIKWLE